MTYSYARWTTILGLGWKFKVLASLAGSFQGQHISTAVKVFPCHFIIWLL
jgi:hypothetical protein